MGFLDGDLDMQKGGIILCFALVIIGVVIYMWNNGVFSGILP